jgi:hypothetical protein
MFALEFSRLEDLDLNNLVAVLEDALERPDEAVCVAHFLKQNARIVFDPNNYANKSATESIKFWALLMELLVMNQLDCSALLTDVVQIIFKMIKSKSKKTN